MRDPVTMIWLAPVVPLASGAVVAGVPLALVLAGSPAFSLADWLVAGTAASCAATAAGAANTPAVPANRMALKPLIWLFISSPPYCPRILHCGIGFAFAV